MSTAFTIMAVLAALVATGLTVEWMRTRGTRIWAQAPGATFERRGPVPEAA